MNALEQVVLELTKFSDEVTVRLTEDAVVVESPAENIRVRILDEDPAELLASSELTGKQLVAEDGGGEVIRLRRRSS
ncbi:MAG: hypothetical protein KatS3mg082_3381 [Nitrospiraceae bacterium]|nr:MAG: hypothetical protein KatS3mg082_3381 [Nitrospiraceae bacterium]